MRKIRIYPNEEQRLKLNQAFDANRWAWNILVEKTRDEIFNDTVKLKDLKQMVRPCVQKRTMDAPERIKEVPDEVLDSAFRDLWKARNSVLAASKAQKKRTGKGFNCKALKFKKKKEASNSIEIRYRSFKINTNGFGLWPSYFGKKSILKIKDDLPPLNYSCRLQTTITGNYYLCVPEYKKTTKSTTTKTCAIDPGVRTMLTGYDPEGFIFEAGLKIDSITKRWLLIDKFKSKLRHFKGRRNERYNLKQEELGIFGKIKNMIKDCHHKLSKWISERYNKVLLPEFKTGEMAKKINRSISSTVVRKMLGWAHWSFKSLLAHKMNMNGNTLIDCTEEYTSKTCTSCGRLNHVLGSSKVFKCPYVDCSFKIDRDIGAARNIYLKNSHLLETV